MTEKLYYQDAYIKEFEAEVVDTYSKDGKNFIILDRTAFFPEGGGQTSDTGFIDNIEVCDVQEKDSVIYHEIKGNIEKGSKVHAVIDFESRFEKMQCHTAEHIISGTIHRLYGFDNVGFHLSNDYVTFDINAEMTREMLDEVENIANQAVYDNIEVETVFPSSEELEKLEYRSKLDLHENVRIVNIGKYDSCACCAPHVKRTGEIGVIKILDFEKHRGGVRVFMLAGRKALRDYRARYLSTLQISGMLSTPQNEIATSVKKLLSDLENEKRNAKEMILQSARSVGEKLSPCEKNAVIYLENSNMDGLREFVKIATSKVGGILVALTGEQGDFKYVMASNRIDLRKNAKEINNALDGRGGGRPEMIQGSCSCQIETVKKYFDETEF